MSGRHNLILVIKGRPHSPLVKVIDIDSYKIDFLSTFCLIFCDFLIFSERFIDTDNVVGSAFSAIFNQNTFAERVKSKNISI